MDEFDFPDLSRQELDVMLAQIRDRADAVLGARSRLRGLLHANALVSAELSLPVVLRRIVEAARHLLQARYAALGVIGSDGMLEQFLHSGIDDDVVSRIGDLPRGRGVLGLLTKIPEPIRLEDLADHADAAGFPEHHPSMESFLGVPIRLGDEVYGNLYLTERVDGGRFTAEDEELAIALAAAAGRAIANAGMFAESEQRRRWLVASARVSHRLLSDDSGPALEMIVKEAAEAAEADFSLVVLPHGERIIIEAVTGVVSTDLVGQSAPSENSLTAEAMRTGLPILSSSFGTTAASAPLGLDVEVGPLVVVPLVSGENVRGALALGRLADRRGFVQADADLAAVFASQAAIALELVEARAREVISAKIADHGRIAADLHEQVIGDLFSLGIELQGRASVSADPADAAQMRGQSEVIDAVIAQIRAIIFQLDSPPPAEDEGIRDRLLGVVDQHTAQLGFTATTQIAENLDPSLGPILADDLIAVTREALANCARHAGATRVSVEVRLRDGNLVLEITDNGRGIGEPGRVSGLSNMSLRAKDHGGAMVTTTPEGGGTRLTWNVKIAE
jgi:signal transduction histidine kinase